MSRNLMTLVSTLALCAGASTAANCSSKPTATATGDGPDAGVPFQADPPAVYVAKVKNILVGLPPTDAEVEAVTADATALAGLIDGWMKLPQYDQKMQVFFQLAFQQTQITSADFLDMFPPNGIGPGLGVIPLIENVRESFARTVIALLDAGAPLNQAMTTKTLMMTPPLMELYAFLDSYNVDDASAVTDGFRTAHPGQVITLETAAGPIPITETLDPTSANYMHWYSPTPAALVYPMQPACTGVDPILFGADGLALHWLLYGGIDNHKDSTKTMNCGGRAGGADLGQFTAADFGAWKMVTIRPPQAGEKTTDFFDLPTLRSATELVLSTPRPGFFSTPAFFANWSTNTSNQMRVTVNQALIVATGQAVDGTDPTSPSTTPGLDATHAAPGTACFGCHQTLDPTRSILASTYSWSYSRQSDPAEIAQKGLFAFQGVVKPVNTIDDFATLLATHPAFPTAWAQKLCYYVNSSPCLATDPEFTRIVKDFQSANFSWSTLVRELLSSPITTNAAPTATTSSAEVVAVSRRDHLCAALNDRLGLNDICQLRTTIPTKATVISEIVSGLPSDGYGRGAPVPVLPNQPTLFYRAGVENICEAVAAMVIDATPTAAQPNVKIWQSTSPQSAISDFVATIMAITPSDARSAPAQALLMGHFNAAVKAGNTASNALKSTFVAACLSPSSVGIGM